MQWYLAVLGKYAEFSGRARRREYWTFFLVNILISVVLLIIDRAAGLGSDTFGLLQSVYALAVLIPGIAVTVRRLHDTGRSGWWMFILLIPIVGAIMFVVYMASEGHAGSNDHGQNPKEVAA